MLYKKKCLFKFIYFFNYNRASTTGDSRERGGGSIRGGILVGSW